MRFTFCRILSGPFFHMNIGAEALDDCVATVNLTHVQAARLWKFFGYPPHELVCRDSSGAEYFVIPKLYYSPNDTVPLSVTTPKGHVARCRAPRTYDSEPTVVFDRYQRYRLYKFFRAHKYRRMEATLARCELRDDTGTRYKYKTL